MPPSRKKPNTLYVARVGDVTLRLDHDAATGRVSMMLFPTMLTDRLAARRTSLRGLPEIDAIPDAGDPPAIVPEPLVQVKLVGDPYPGAFAQGRTMRGGPSVERFRYVEHRVHTEGVRTSVITTLRSDDGLRIEHGLAWHEGESAVEVSSAFFNGSASPVTLEMLSSFALGGITPFHHADAPGQLRVHRFRSVWSAEGRLETRTLEELHLERSWSGAGAFSERFGQVGSMPVRGWFPFVAVEDTAAGVVWGANLAWAGSWQMEIFRQHDDVCISGGLADREFGHWTKQLAPGESLVAPTAMLACVHGTLDDLCDRLTAPQHRAADAHPAIECDLPIVFNEWCTTWGDPSHEKVLAVADRLRGTQVKYLVIDAGWYKGAGADWNTGHGDWIPSPALFPDGLEATANAIRERGLVPGLWFEMETVGSSSAAFSLDDHLLKRDGIPLTVRGRRFWDLCDPFAIDYLTDKVINLLERCGFGYLKIDYNETIGIGCDSRESHGEGLRRHTEGVYRFFERIRERLPDLVIESCSSGGHRLEPSMLGRSAMSSFSDAHELVEIPIIAANLHRLMLPRQSQIWAVLHPTDSDQRLAYSLSATFLGRMCLSGDVVGLSGAKWRLVNDAQALYARVAPIIKHGVSRRCGETGPSWRHPTGWQAVVRTGAEASNLRDHALVVLHTFADSATAVGIPLENGRSWRVVEQFPETAAPPHFAGARLLCGKLQPFSGQVILLRSERKT